MLDGAEVLSDEEDSVRRFMSDMMAVRDGDAVDVEELMENEGTAIWKAIGYWICGELWEL